MRLRHGGRSRRLKPAALGRDTSRCAELLFPLAIPNAHGRLEEVMVGRKGAHLQHMLSLRAKQLCPKFLFLACNKKSLSKFIGTVGREGLA
jgi:hypothetical protein